MLRWAMACASVACLSACATGAREGVPGSVGESVTSLLGEVCLPYVVDGTSEDDVVAGRGFRRDLSASLSSHMQLQGGLSGSFYETGYPGIKQLKISTRIRQCTIQADAGFGADEVIARVGDALDGRAETWTHVEAPLSNAIAQGRWTRETAQGTELIVTYIVTSDGSAVTVSGGR